MITFVYKGLTRNPETDNTPVWVLPNIWRLDWVSNNKFGTKIANEKLLNAVNGRVTAYRFWFIKENQQELGEGGDFILDFSIVLETSLIISVVFYEYSFL